MSNLHKDLNDSQLHVPKGFVSAANSTKLTKNASGNLEWAADASGESCGLNKNIDSGIFGPSITFGTTPYTATLNLANCSGGTGVHHELEIGLAYVNLGDERNIGDVWLKVVANTGQVITDKINTLSTYAYRDCGTCETTGVCYMYGFWKIFFIPTSTAITSLDISIGSGCENYRVIDSVTSQASYVTLKDFCSPITPQLFTSKAGEAPKK